MASDERGWLEENMRDPEFRLLYAKEMELEAERAISDFWEAEAARAKAQKVGYEHDKPAWKRFFAATPGEVDIGDPSGPCNGDGVPVPRLVWWHAHRRTR